jgi:metal-dependent HD superfamily phosphatase/phosphodiesterase
MDMVSTKEVVLDEKLLRMVSGRALKVAEIMLKDKEIHHLQDYANTISIKRLGYNDHGPVHMRKVVMNALVMADLLNKAGVKLNIENEDAGTFEDSKIAVMLASFLHDIGMSVGREKHEIASAMLAIPIIDRILSAAYGDSPEKKVVIRSMIIEGILGHMGGQRIESLEAGIILIADGCDMEKGRARIPMMLKKESKIGDIHKYSSSSIQKVTIGRGEKRPIKITAEMDSPVGFFQVEEVLLKKINLSPVKPYIEVFAGIAGQGMKCYL